MTKPSIKRINQSLLNWLFTRALEQAPEIYEENGEKEVIYSFSCKALEIRPATRWIWQQHLAKKSKNKSTDKLVVRCEIVDGIAYREWFSICNANFKTYFAYHIESGPVEALLCSVEEFLTV